MATHKNPACESPHGDYLAGWSSRSVRLLPSRMQVDHLNATNKFSCQISPDVSLATSQTSLAFGQPTRKLPTTDSIECVHFIVWRRDKHASANDALTPSSTQESTNSTGCGEFPSKQRISSGHDVWVRGTKIKTKQRKTILKEENNSN